MIDRTISHYKIVEKLGEGGMGVVYKAEDTKLKRTVALKFLPPELTRNADAKDRFVREAQAASALDHNNVCTIYEIDETEEGQTFIVMACYEGETLKDKIQKGPLKVDEAIDITFQVAEGLKKAHDKGIVHRDIKPANIFITEDGVIKILDFGLAKLAGLTQLTRTGTTLGTISYMSPEQAKGEKIDHRTDIWSLGVVLYEILTGQLPFKGEYDSAMMYAIVNEEPEPIQKYRSDLSSELLHVLSRALEKAPGERYQSVNDMLIDLKRLKRDTDKVSRKSLKEMPLIPERKKSLISKSGVRLITGVVGLAVILFILFQFIQKGSKNQPFEQMQITQVTTHGKAKMAAISPDGRYIVHVMKKAGKESLWLRQVATGSNVEILPLAAVRFIGLTFSSNGNYIYYVIRPVDLYYGTLYRLPVLGGTSLKVCERVDSPVAFSPDSKKLAFIRLKLNPLTTELILFDISQKKEDTLSVQNSPGIFGNWGLSWSPDGRFITCSKENPKPGQEPFLLVNVSVADGNITNIISKRWGDIDQIAWLSNGSGLIISAADQSTSYFYRLWFVSYPEGQAHLITPEVNNYLNVSLTRDMSTLLTTRSEWSSNIYLSSTDNPDQAQQITSGTYAGFFGVAWTPDGRLVYGSRDFKLWIMNRDGSGQKLLTGNEVNNWRPDVSPDGKYIVFQSWRGKYTSTRIWRMDIDGNNPIALTEGQWDDRPRVSPDGKWVVYQSESSGVFSLWKVGISGGEATQVVKYLSYYPAISPDGKWIACFASDQSDHPDQFQIIVIPFEGGKPTYRYSVSADIERSNDLHWTPDGKSLAYISAESGAGNIWIKTLDESPAVQLTHLKNRQIFRFGWSEDGKYLAYAAGEMNDDVILVRNFK